MSFNNLTNTQIQLNLSNIESLTKILYTQPNNSENITILNQYQTIIESSVNVIPNVSKEENGFMFLFDSLIKTEFQHSQFWILESLSKTVVGTYSSMTPEIKQFFRNELKNCFSTLHFKYSKLPYLVSKLALVMVYWMKFDYPENYPTMLSEFFELATILPKNDDEKIIKIDLLITFLITFDDELLQNRHTLTYFDEERSTIIKDFMRNDAFLPQLLGIINTLIKNRENLPEKLVCNCLKLSGLLIDWNSLNLFVN